MSVVILLFLASYANFWNITVVFHCYQETSHILFCQILVFKAANSQRGVLFILLLGFMLQSVLVAATPFFEYDTPDWRQYSFIGSCCLLLFCIKLLYCDDANTLASDHALLVNRTAAAFFNIGQFALLFSTTILGSGLNLLTHHYLAAIAALPGNDKSFVCCGFGGTLNHARYRIVLMIEDCSPDKVFFFPSFLSTI